MAITSQSFGAKREHASGRTFRLPFGLNWTQLGLFAIVALAAALRFGNIGAIGEANTYYTAAVKSMLQSWHNFFFVAAEPGGSVSIDKPPVGLWLQTISAYFLGVSGFSVVLPQILAGIASVVVLFHLVRRSFGNIAGLIAALVLAVTPVAIAVERNNTPDATLILSLLLAAWTFLKATETRKLRFLLFGAVLVGIGFNIKMMQALLPLPAFYALYLFGSEQRWWKKIVHLVVTTLVLIPIALSWAIAVDLTPANQRPYVGSSSTNSELDLMLGYNGLQRLLGNQFGGNRAQAATPSTTTGSAQSLPAMPAQDGAMGAAPPAGGPGGQTGFGGSGTEQGGMFGTGQVGVFRLFQSGLAAQVSWLLPFGLIALGAMATVAWRREQIVLRRAVLLWGGWLVTCAVFFSVAGFFHQYYLAMLGAPLAAVVAIGTVWLWRLQASHRLRAALLLVLAAAATLAFQIYAVNMYGSLGLWVALPIALAVAGLAILVWSLRRTNQTSLRFAFSLIIAALLVVPAVWSGLTTAYANTSSGLTQAYGGTNRQGMPGADRIRRDGANAQLPANASTPNNGQGGQLNQALLSYLEANTQNTKYLLVVPSSGAGAEYVLATGRPVLYAGGFSGSDSVIDGTGLAQLVANGDVRYVLWGSDNRGGNTKSSITSYLQSSCVVTDAGLTSTASSGPGGASTLYDCSVK